MNQYIDFYGNREQLIKYNCELYSINSDLCEEICNILLKEEQKETQLNRYFFILDDYNPVNYQLYIRDTKYHFCVKKIIIDTLAAAAISFVSTGDITLGVVLNSIWNAKKYIVKIQPDWFCVYLKIHYYFMSRPFTEDELFNRCQTDLCNNSTCLFKCGFLKDGKCTLNKESFITCLRSLERNNVIDPTNSNNTYKLNI